jgi:hypothetical protein
MSLRWCVPHHQSHSHSHSSLLLRWNLIPYLLALVCTHFALTLILTISPVPHHQWHADILMRTIGCCTCTRVHSHTKIHTHPLALIYSYFHTRSQCVVCLLPCALQTMDGVTFHTTCINFSTYNILFTSQNRYCCCHLADMPLILYCIPSHCKFSLQCLVAEGGLVWALLMVFDDAYFVLFTTFHSFPFAFFFLVFCCVSCHASGGPFGCGVLVLLTSCYWQ